MLKYWLMWETSNTGVFKFEPLEGVTEDEFHREFNANVLGSI